MQLGIPIVPLNEECGILLCGLQRITEISLLLISDVGDLLLRFLLVQHPFLIL